MIAKHSSIPDGTQSPRSKDPADIGRIADDRASRMGNSKRGCLMD
jgi:hypothetical protein